MIVIVDDDAAIRSSLTFLLKRAGYETQAVETPEKALAIVRKIAPRLYGYEFYTDHFRGRRSSAIKTSQDISAGCARHTDYGMGIYLVSRSGDAERGVRFCDKTME